MDEGKEEEELAYVIDTNDVITSVGENWLLFARDNGGGETCDPSVVVSRRLSGFIADAETRYLYKVVLQRIRFSMRTIMLPFRCDSPEKRRFLELRVEPFADGHVEFRSRLLRIEGREPVALLGKDVSRSGGLVRMCSLCKRIEVSAGEWAEVEAGIARLGLFAVNRPPHLTHSLCEACHADVMARLNQA